MTSLAAELGLRDQASSTADTMVARFADHLDGCTTVAAPQDQGLVALAAMVGALTLARAVADPAMSDRILAAVVGAVQPVARKT